MRTATQEFTTAADLLRFEQARSALRHLAQSDGIYTLPEEKYDPSALPEDSKKARALRKMRQMPHNGALAEVEAFIMEKPEVIQVAIPPTRMERLGLVTAILSALLLAPLAVLAGLLALANPAFTGFSDRVFPIALAEHLVWHASQAELIGYAAAATMLLTFSMKNAVMLRLLAIVANIFFISYGIGAGLVPVVLLHMVLAPINIGHLCRALHNQGARPWGDAKALGATTN
ncbi:MAG: hypothetical protein AAGB10_02855 [Pseudomonadota bacterium]